MSTLTGDDWLLFVPIPNSPFALYPHVHTVPSLFSATVVYWVVASCGNVISPSPRTITST